MAKTQQTKQKGFTIVELLIVIVVIGILAAITIVAYNGIQKRATETVLKSDLSQAARFLESKNITNDEYPIGDGGNGESIGLKTSGGTTFQYTSDSVSYCLTGTTGNKVPAYIVTNENSTPHEGVCPGHTGAQGGSGSSVAASSLACFSISGAVVTDYYDHEDNDGSKPACPRDVVIPDSVTSIGGSAFYRKGLTSVIIPNSITTIGDSAFVENHLTSVAIPDSVTTIGVEAFLFNNEKLTSVTLGSSVKVIGAYAFQDNELTSIVIPHSVTTIGAGAFHSNRLLSSVTIPDSVETIGSQAFNRTALTSVSIPTHTVLEGTVFGADVIITRR